MKYRILETSSGFYIQAEKEEKKISGLLWWKKTEIVYMWLNIGENGLIPVSYHRLCVFISPMPPFKTLVDAKNYIDKLKFKPIIHEL